MISIVNLKKCPCLRWSKTNTTVWSKQDKHNSNTAAIKLTITPPTRTLLSMISVISPNQKLTLKTTVKNFVNTISHWELISKMELWKKAKAVNLNLHKKSVSLSQVSKSITKALQVALKTDSRAPKNTTIVCNKTQVSSVVNCSRTLILLSKLKLIWMLAVWTSLLGDNRNLPFTRLKLKIRTRLTLSVGCQLKNASRWKLRCKEHSSHSVKTKIPQLWPHIKPL